MKRNYQILHIKKKKKKEKNNKIIIKEKEFIFHFELDIWYINLLLEVLVFV